MATERRPKEAFEILDALHSLSLDTEEEILAMPRDQVRARLQEEGIDPDAGKSALKSKLQEVRGRQRLEDARLRRQAHEADLAQRQPATNRLDFDQMRGEVSRRLNQLSPAGSAQVQAYFSRFQSAADDDLPGLLDDLRMLDEMDGEGKTDAG